MGIRKGLARVAALATREEPPGGTKTRPTPRGVGSFWFHQGVPLSWPVQQPRAQPCGIEMRTKNQRSALLAQRVTAPQGRASKRLASFDLHGV